MKKIKLTTISMFAIAATILSSCSITLPVTATSNTVGSKVGRSTATGYLGIIFLDADASIRSAAKQGGITKISTVDIKASNFLNIITSYETIVTGE